MADAPADDGFPLHRLLRQLRQELEIAIDEAARTASSIELRRVVVRLGAVSQTANRSPSGPGRVLQVPPLIDRAGWQLEVAWSGGGREDIVVEEPLPFEAFDDPLRDLRVAEAFAQLPPQALRCLDDETIIGLDRRGLESLREIRAVTDAEVEAWTRRNPDLLWSAARLLVRTLYVGWPVLPALDLDPVSLDRFIGLSPATWRDELGVDGPAAERLPAHFASLSASLQPGVLLETSWADLREAQAVDAARLAGEVAGFEEGEDIESS